MTASLQACAGRGWRVFQCSNANRLLQEATERRRSSGPFWRIGQRPGSAQTLQLPWKSCLSPNAPARTWPPCAHANATMRSRPYCYIACVRDPEQHSLKLWELLHD